MIDLAEYDRAHAEYKSRWEVMDATLQDLCEKHPGHGDLRVVVAKLAIIGRAYATGLERGVRSLASQGGALLVIADHVYENRAEIDRIIRRVIALRGRPDEEKLTTILRAHGRLAALISEVTIKGRSARSFVSKYLHFHSPIVPIYDSYAWNRLREIVPQHRELELLPELGDSPYRRFLERYWSLHRELRRAGRKPTARRIDSYLLHRG